MSNMFHCVICDTTVWSEEVYNQHLEAATQPFQCSQCLFIFTDICVFEMHNKLKHSELRENLPQPLSRDSNAAGRQTKRTQNAYTRSGRHSLPHSLASSAVVRRRTTRQPGIPGPAHGDSSLVFPAREGKGQLSESARSEASSVLKPSKPPQGDLIDLETTCDKDQSETLQSAFANLQSIVSSRQGEANKEPSKAQLKPHPNMPHATGEPWDVINNSERRSSANSTLGLSSGIVCFECNATFSSVLGLQQHQMIHGHNYCRLCFSFFSDGSILEQHNELVHKFRCIGCMGTFTGWLELMKHQRSDGHGFCAICDSFFTSRASMEGHARKIHGATRYAHFSKDSDTKSDISEYQKTTADDYCNQREETLNGERISENANITKLEDSPGTEDDGELEEDTASGDTWESASDEEL